MIFIDIPDQRLESILPVAGQALSLLLSRAIGIDPSQTPLYTIRIDDGPERITYDVTHPVTAIVEGDWYDRPDRVWFGLRIASLSCLPANFQASWSSPRSVLEHSFTQPIGCNAQGLRCSGENSMTFELRSRRQLNGDLRIITLANLNIPQLPTIRLGQPQRNSSDLLSTPVPASMSDHHSTSQLNPAAAKSVLAMVDAGLISSQTALGMLGLAAGVELEAVQQQMVVTDDLVRMVASASPPPPSIPTYQERQARVIEIDD